MVNEVTNNAEINVIMNTYVDGVFINTLNPDAVIIAIGSKPLIPSIPGVDTAMDALYAYNNLDKIGENVILVGGGLVGCEVGLFLAHLGKKVSVIEMNKMMAFETFGYYRNALLNEMDKRKITQYLNAKCLNMCPEGVTVLQDGYEKFLPADTVIYSMGMIANTEATTSLQQACKGRTVFTVGDCVKAGKLGDSVRDGYMAALKIL